MIEGRPWTEEQLHSTNRLRPCCHLWPSPVEGIRGLLPGSTFHPGHATDLPLKSLEHSRFNCPVVLVLSELSVQDKVRHGSSLMVCCTVGGDVRPPPKFAVRLTSAVKWPEVAECNHPAHPTFGFKYHVLHIHARGAAIRTSRYP